MTGRPAIFLDRDGTVIVERGYLGDPAGVELEKEAGPSLARLQRAGWLLVLITNQSGVARGYFGENDVSRVNAAVRAQLAMHDVRLDGIYCCFHGPEGGCDCRKPAPGLLLQAATELGIDLGCSFVIGDKISDVEAGRRVGARGILVTTGHGTDQRDPAMAAGYAVASGLAEAADLIPAG